MRQTVEVLVGLPASGKSSYARRRSHAGALVLDYDAFNRMLYAGRYAAEPALARDYVLMLQDVARRAVCLGRDLVVDAAHTTRPSRAVWTDWAGTAPLPPRVEAVVFPTGDLDAHAERRFNADARGRSMRDWLAAVDWHDRALAAEPVGAAAEGFDAVRFLTESDVRSLL